MNDRKMVGLVALGPPYYLSNPEPETIMKLRISLCSTFVFATALLAGGSPVSAASDPDIPHFQKHGTATQLVVDGKPFLALAGELSNNSATSLEYMTPLWPRLVEAKLNTVLAGVSWAQIEPEEGKFDFRVLDGVIREAHRHNLRLVLLWFGTWKTASPATRPTG